MTYASGFSEGERQAWLDRKADVQRAPKTPRTETQRGFSDGYTPRSATWWRRADKPQLQPWQAAAAVAGSRSKGGIVSTGEPDNHARAFAGEAQ